MSVSSFINSACNCMLDSDSNLLLQVVIILSVFNLKLTFALFGTKLICRDDNS